MAEAAIERVGIGTDLHRLAVGRRLVLGGVVVPFEKGLQGHSDADVVLHALVDAVLGAAGLPDIGELFPDGDVSNKDADSRRLLAVAIQKAAERGWRVVNVDLVIQAEQPRLSPYKEAIRASLAELLGISADRVGVKAKSNEGVDAIGRGEAIGCTCAVGLGRACD